MATNECGALTEQVYDARFRPLSKVADSVTSGARAGLDGAALTVPGRPSKIGRTIGEPATSEGTHGGS